MRCVLLHHYTMSIIKTCTCCSKINICIFDVYCKVNTIVLTVYNLMSTCAHPWICGEVHVSPFFRFWSYAFLFVFFLCLASDVVRVSVLFILDFPYSFLLSVFIICDLVPVCLYDTWKCLISFIMKNKRHTTFQYYLTYRYVLTGISI